MKPPIRALLLLGIGLVTGAALAALYLSWQQEDRIEEAGAPLLDAATSEVRFLTYYSENVSLTAQRSSPDALFSVQVTRAGSNTPEHCVSSRDLVGILTTLSNVRVRAIVADKERNERFPSPAGYIEVKDAVYGEPPSPWFLYESKDGSAVAIEKSTHLYVTDVSAALIKKLSLGCAALSAE